MKEYITAGLVEYKGTVYVAANDIGSILEKYKEDMLAGSIEKGTIRGSATIRGTAAIITASGKPPNIQIN